jgi:hypothetical protein
MAEGERGGIGIGIGIDPSKGWELSNYGSGEVIAPKKKKENPKPCFMVVQGKKTSVDSVWVVAVFGSKKEK